MVAFYSARDIPGMNAFTGPGLLFMTEIEELFVGDRVKYHGQAAGVIVAESYDLAYRAAGLVTIRYSTQPTPPGSDLETQRQLETDFDALRLTKKETKSVITPSDKIPKHITATETTGSFSIPSQYHFMMEPHTTICELREDGMDIYSSTQSIDSVQSGVQMVLNWPAHKLNLEVRRLGGAFGAKITRSTHMACACALACFHLKRRVRFVMSIEHMMMVYGARYPAWSDYRVIANTDGSIQRLQVDLYSDFGCSLNEDASSYYNLGFTNVYQATGWESQITRVVTATPSNTFNRAPGTLEGIAMIENIMEHVAFDLQRDALQVRMANLNPNSNIPMMLNQFIPSINYHQRQMEIQDFNAANRWKKRGLAVVPMSHRIITFGVYASIVSIYHIDGTVSIAHGGIDMGQGLNTKVCQVAAHILGIPLELVTTKPNREYVSPNTAFTGGSHGSETVSFVSDLYENYN